MLNEKMPITRLQGGVTHYAFDFPALTDDRTGDYYIGVYLENNDPTSPDIGEVVGPLTPGADYTVEVSVDEQGNNIGGDVVFPSISKPTMAQNVIIRAETPLSQTRSYKGGGKFPAASHENALDKLTRINQEQSMRLTGTIRVPDYEADAFLTELPRADLRANKMFGFDATGAVAFLEGLDQQTVDGLRSDASEARLAADEANAAMNGAQSAEQSALNAVQFLSNVKYTTVTVAGQSDYTMPATFPDLDARRGIAVHISGNLVMEGDYEVLDTKTVRVNAPDDGIPIQFSVFDGMDAGDIVSDARVAEVNATAAAQDAASYAAGLNIPGVEVEDTGKVLGVKPDGSGYQLVSPFPTLNVTMFGAVGDGVTDDTAAIRAACVKANEIGGGAVYLPRGTYGITGQIEVPSNVAVIGDGWNSLITVLSQFAPEEKGILHDAGGLGTQDSRITIKDLAFDGVAVDRVQNGIWLENADSVLIDNVRGMNIGYSTIGNGMVVAAVSNARITNSYFWNSFGPVSGIWITNNKGHDCQIYGCNIMDCYEGIRTDDGTDNILVSANMVTLCRATGIDMFDGSNVVVTGNSVSDSGGAGVVFGSGATKRVRGVLTGNLIVNSGHAGIMTENTDEISITGNVIRQNNDLPCIFVRSSNFGSVKGNVANNTGTGGCIKCENTVDIKVADDNAWIAPAGVERVQTSGTTHGTLWATSFSIWLKMEGGVLKHAISNRPAIMDDDWFLQRINNPEKTLQSTPTGDNATTAFSHGAKVDSSYPDKLLIDTKAGAMDRAQNISATVEKNTTGSPIIVRINIAAQNVNGVTKNRLGLNIRDAATDVGVNLTTLSEGSQIFITVSGEME